MMKNIIIIVSIFLITDSHFLAQTIATDFTMNDCNGQMHHLFSELDSGNVVILEFFMLSCSPCIEAGDHLEPMYQNLIAEYGNKVRFYHFGFNNTYTCNSIKNWVTTNGYSSVPFDSGAVQVAYYGGMGMPTIAVVAGNTHEVLFTNVGFSTSDTTTIGTEIRNFLGSTGIESRNSETYSFSIFPNPSSSDNFNLLFEAEEPGMINVELINVNGQVENSIQETIPQGLWTNSFSNFELAKGIYFIKGRFNEINFSKKIIIHK